MDFGAKNNIAMSLNERGCEVTVYPAGTKAEEIIAANPDGIMLSNGPGDPETCVSIIEEIKKLYNTDIPIFAICLGHQLMALANGAKTYKLKYGHTFLHRTMVMQLMVQPLIRLSQKKHLSM